MYKDVKTDVRTDVRTEFCKDLRLDVRMDVREDVLTGRQYHKKPPNLAKTLSFIRPTKKTKSRGGSGGQRPPDIVPGTAGGAEGARAAEGAAGARGEIVISCATEALPGLRVCISRPRNVQSSLKSSYQ